MTNTQHNYGYDINRIISLSNEQNLSQVESYALDLDSQLSNLTQPMTQDFQLFLDKTIDFLYGVVAE